MKRVLVVEDENSIREMIALNLDIAGFTVVDVPSAEAGLEVLRNDIQGFEVAILDVMLPGMNGFEMCEAIRKDYDKMGIIILSAKSQEIDKINGLSLGADDYMSKPFSVSELLARVEALCRRVARNFAEPIAEDKLCSGIFVLDCKSRILYKNNKEIDLTQIEYQVIEFFIKNPNVAMDRDKILVSVWGENYYGDAKIVDVNIRRLRMKIEDDPSQPVYIMTVWGYGYRWNA